MPGYRVHLLGGLVSFVLLYSLGLKEAWPMSLMVSLFGSLFPDLDTKSKVQIYTYRILAVFALFLALFQCWQFLVILVPILLFPLIIHHRGITHRIWFLALVASLVYFYVPCLGQYAAIYFFVAAFSHIILDKLVK